MLQTGKQLKDELTVIRDDVYKCAVEHGWWEEERNFGELLALVHSEITEAVEHIDVGQRVNAIYVREGKNEGVVIDLADVVIRVLDIAGKYDFDLQWLVEYHEATGHDIRRDLLDLHSSVSFVLEISRKYPVQSEAVERGLAELLQHTVKVAEEWNLDIYNAVKNKAAYNWTRPYKHNKKF